MRKIPLEEVKKIELDILKYIKHICENNNLKYTLAAGTLLGAVRHRGFIPWDDDIDICLPWNDYKKLIEILRNDKRYLLLYDMDKLNYPYDFAKLTDPNTIAYESNKPKSAALGIWVDIFPNYNIPECISYNDYWSKMDRLNTIIFRSIGWNYCYDPSIMKTVIKSILYLPETIYYKMKGTKYWKEKRRKLQELGQAETSEFVAYVPSERKERALYPAQMFQSYTLLQFEDEQFSVIKDWDVYLKQLYGDYMQLPPLGERVNKHFIAYYND